jgi:ABC-type branched-subunit amino acid transport system ATPase component
MAKILEIKNLVVDYGIIRAIKGIDLSVEEGTNYYQNCQRNC